jgi:hypothetical protein
MKGLAAAVFVLAQLSVASAQSGNDMLTPCKQFVNGEAFGFREGLCAGAVTSLNFISSIYPPQHRFCAPVEVTNNQLVRVVVAFMEANPARLHEDYRSLAMQALRQAWPCK